MLTRYERETIINFNEDDDTADVYTHNQRLIRRLTEAKATVVRRDEKYGSVTFRVPKRWVKVSPPRKGNVEAGKRLAASRHDAQSTPKTLDSHDDFQGSLCG